MKLRGMIKRALSVLLALSMVLSTTACSKKPVDTGLSDPNPQVIVENIETENIETENVLTEFEQNRALHDGLIYISASPLVAVLFFVYDYSNNISAKEKAL